MEKRVANAREMTGNGDICAVLACLVSQDATGEARATPPWAERADIEAFRLDHAHHADRLPVLLRELSARTHRGNDDGAIDRRAA